MSADPGRVRVAAQPRPFSQARSDLVVPAGLSLAEIVAVAIPDPDWHDHAVVLVGDEEIEPRYWRGYRPRPGTALAVHIVPRGQNGWRIAGMIAIAVLAITVSAVTYGQLLPVAGATWASVGAGVAGATVSIAGTFALNALVPPPVPEVSRDYGNGKPTWAITGARNRADPWGKVPFLLGRMRLTPPYAAAPYREIVGGDVYWRAIFALSHGPVAIDEMRIGETLLANFAGVELEFRRGYWTMPDRGSWNPQGATFPPAPGFGDTWTASAAGSVAGTAYKTGESITFNGLYPAADPRAWDRDQDKPFRLYPKDVHEEGFALDVETSVVRTSQANADELAVEFVFPRGLCHIQNDPPGKRADKTVNIRIRQRPVGTQAWANVTTRTVTGRQLTPLYVGHRWKPTDFGTADPERKYDIEIANLSGSFDEERNFGRFQLLAIRTVTAENPVPVPGVAMMAVRILSSGQLQGVLDEFRVIARTLARDYDATLGSWVWRPTSAPSALVRHVLQHPARLKPAADDRIDLARLAQWDDLCRAKGWVYNGVAEAKGSLWETLVGVCRVGRATPSLRDLIFSVVVDEPKTAPVRLFTPRNSWAYEGELDHGPMPHGYRIGYIDAERDWRPDEVVVYADGYDAATATRIDRVEWPGITSRAQATREGRYHLAQRRLRREVHRITVDFEHLACERGDLVALQHDVIAVGIGSARIASRSDDGQTMSGFELDAPVPVEDGKSYGIRVRRVVGGAQVTTLLRVTAQGSGLARRFDFATPTPLAEAPDVGDLVAFGEWDRETLRVLIRDIEPRDELTARLTLIAEAPGVHVASQGPVPPYDPKVTAPTAIPAPVVTEVRSDTGVMLLTASRTLVERVVFSLAPIGIAGTSMHVLYRPAGTSAPWAAATVQEETATSVAIVGLTSGETYDFRLQRTRSGLLASPATSVNGHFVVGRTAAPAALANLTLVAVGGQALLRWDLPVDLDVQFGGWILFRHTPAMVDASWANTVSIGRAVNGDQSHVFLPLKAGTYMARAYDSLGNVSEPVAVTTKQASVLAFSPVAELVEDPAFPGSHDDTETLAGVLQLRSGDFDAVADTDELPDWDLGGAGIVPAGTYRFSAGMDFGQVKRVRLTSHIAMAAVNPHDRIDDRAAPIDDWGDVDGTAAAVTDASVWARTTDDDPAGTPTWGPWIRVDAADVTARAVGQVECRLGTADQTFNIQISELRLKAEEVI